MANDTTQIKCPSCGTSIDVQDIISHQIEEEVKKKYQAELNAQKKKLEQSQDQLAKQKEDYEQQQRKANEELNERLQAKLKEERKTLEEELKNKLKTENTEQFEALQKELNEKSQQIKELNRTKAEVEKLKREKDEIKEIVEAEAQKQLNEALLAEKEKIKKAEEDKNELRIKELQKQLEDQKKLTEEMKRKQDQGSMQLQGEVQELAVEEWLKVQFPLDTIEEIKKGARGGDCLQIINTHTKLDCGKIYYESKRTKDFQNTWIDKFKNDMREKKATIGVLVTEAMPANFERMGMLDGVWVCSYQEFKGLCTVLRAFVIDLDLATSSQENRGDKMSLLYGYLTGPDFRLQVEAIVDGFSSLKEALETEKRAMQRIWKEREKQIEKVMLNTVDMYGSIKGIAGNAIGSVKALELSPGD